MTDHTDRFGNPIGFPVPNWTPRATPPRTPMTGRFALVEPLDPARHAASLFAANRQDAGGRNFTYLGVEPFDDLDRYTAYLEKMAATTDPMFHAIVDRATGKAVGVGAYLRIDAANGVIEVGHLNFSPLLQRRPAATEAMFLMMARAFDELGYRRYEWKCDSLNAPSRRAAARLGFIYEGIFRQALVYKGRNRDTAWYAIIDQDWPRLRQAYLDWLAPANFDAEGHQRRSLEAFRGDKA